MWSSITKEENKLDSPVWHSLNETHHPYIIELNGINFYSPEYCAFGGTLDRKNTSAGIDEYTSLSNDFYVVGEKPAHSSQLCLQKNVACDQLLLKKPIVYPIKESIVTITESKQKMELYDLVQEVQPGYFKSKTMELGHYFGIYKKGKLVAAAGERMKMNAFTEISAIVTHPEYQGKGFASQLIAHTTQHIFTEKKLPYLHVKETNSNAIRLYKKLGFTHRRKISFWWFMKSP